jgi:uncharacterized membrane protein
VQAQYRAAPGAIMEKPDGAIMHGATWMTNDAVNLVASLIGGAAGAGVGALFF